MVNTMVVISCKSAMSAANTRDVRVLARLIEVCTSTHKDAQDPDHRHNALLDLKHLLSTPGQQSEGSIGNKDHILKELKDHSCFTECVRRVLDIADDKEAHARIILQAAGRDHDRQQEIEVKNLAASLIAPLFFHYYLAGHDSSIILDYIFKLLATEDRTFQYAEGDPNSLLLLPQAKRGYAQTAFAGIIEMVKLHSSTSAHVEAGGWGDFMSAQRMMIQRIVETLNPAKALPCKFSAMLSSHQIQKDIHISMGALAMVLKCLEVPQICIGVNSKAMFGVLRPLIVPVGFKYTDGGAFRKRAIQCAVLLALLGQPEGDFHPWYEVIEKTILDRLRSQPASLLPKIQGDRLRQEFLTEQKDLIDGLMFVLKDDNHDREYMPAVAASYFSNTRKLKDIVECLDTLNAFTQIQDFVSEYQAEEFFGLAVGVTAASCRLLQAVCCRFPLSCTVEETLPIFLNHVECALPMEEGHILQTPMADDTFEDEDDFDFDDTPSRSSTINENDPLSEMYMAALELEASLVKHAYHQIGAEFAKERLTCIMMQMYRKTTLEFRVKDQVLFCITRYYNLSYFSKKESEFFATMLLEWNKLDRLIENVPSAVVAVDFMNTMISSDQTTPEARMPFLDLTFVYVSQVITLALPKYFSSNDVVRKLVHAAIQFLLHAAHQMTRGGLLRGTVENSKIVETLLQILKHSSSSDSKNADVVSCCMKALRGIVETGGAVSFYRNICMFLLELFASFSKVASSNFLKFHLNTVVGLLATILRVMGPEDQEAACKLVMALLEYGRSKKDATALVFNTISEITPTKQFQYSPEIIRSIQEQAIELIANESGSVLLSSLSCIFSISNFCDGALDKDIPSVLIECFKKASQMQPPDFEVCCQILKIAALYGRASEHSQFSEILADGMFFLSKDCCNFAFVEVLCELAIVQRDAAPIIELAVARLKAESPGIARKKPTSVSLPECTLPVFIGVLFSNLSPSHLLRSTALAIVKNSLQASGLARIFGMQCLQFVPQRVDQLAAYCFDEADIVLNAFVNMTSDHCDESNAIHDATAAYLMVNSEGFAKKLFDLVHGSVRSMIEATSDQLASAAAVALPQFLFFRKALGQWIERSIVKVVDGQLRWHGGNMNCNSLIQSMLELCFQVPLSSDGPYAAISNICAGILGMGLYLDFRGADGDCLVLTFAQKERAKMHAVILDVVLASLSGSNSARDDMSQAVNDSTIQMIRLFSIEILAPSSSVPELTGSDVNTKMFKSALSACIAAIDAFGSAMSLDLFDAMASGTCEFLRRFSNPTVTSNQPHGSSVQIWKAWGAFGKSQMTWSTMLTKAAIRKDDNGDQGYTFRDFTHSLRSLALSLLSKVASAALFAMLRPELKTLIVQCVISHLDDFRPEVSQKANEIMCDFFKLRELRSLMKQQDICKILCDEINGIRATFSVFDEIAQSATSEAPKGSASSEQLLKLKRFFIKATDLGADKSRAKERKLRIQNTYEMVQALLPGHTLL